MGGQKNRKNRKNRKSRGLEVDGWWREWEDWEWED